MSLRDAILDYIDENYGDRFVSEELEEKILELEEFIEASFVVDDDGGDEPLDFVGDMDDYNDEE